MSPLTGPDGWRILVWSALCLGGVGLVAIVAWRLRTAYWRSDDSHMPAPPAFTLKDLTDLRERGELTEDEFKRMRSRVLSAETGRPAPTAGDRRLRGQ